LAKRRTHTFPSLFSRELTLPQLRETVLPLLLFAALGERDGRFVCSALCEQPVAPLTQSASARLAVRPVQGQDAV
jgi:hypothetical protein